MYNMPSKFVVGMDMVEMDVDFYVFVGISILLYWTKSRSILWNLRDPASSTPISSTFTIFSFSS